MNQRIEKKWEMGNIEKRILNEDIIKETWWVEQVEELLKNTHDGLDADIGHKKLLNERQTEVIKNIVEAEV